MVRQLIERFLQEITVEDEAALKEMVLNLGVACMVQQQVDRSSLVLLEIAVVPLDTVWYLQAEDPDEIA